jgi:hypothetical protein
VYFSCIGWVQSFSHFSAVFFPGTFHREGPGERKQPAYPAAFHGFFGGHIVHVSKRIQQVVRKPQPVFLPPLYGRKNMKEGYHFREIGLMITYE